MQVKKVSALRRKRGLHRVNGAAPPVVGRKPRPISSPPDGALFAQSVAMGLTLIASRPFDQHNFNQTGVRRCGAPVPVAVSGVAPW